MKKIKLTDKFDVMANSTLPTKQAQSINGRQFNDEQNDTFKHDGDLLDEELLALVFFQFMLFI